MAVVICGKFPVYATYRFNSKRNHQAGSLVWVLSSYFMTKKIIPITINTIMEIPLPVIGKTTILPIIGFLFWVFRRLGKKYGSGLSLGVAPYAKIPLQGVGFGDMSLSSYGLNLILTYRKATGRK
jgi:hypothetical protein